MKDKTKAQLINELKKLRKQIVKLEKSETKRKYSEEKLREQHEFMEKVLGSLTYPFYVIDIEDYTIKMENPAAHFSKLSKKSTCYALTHRYTKPCEGEEHPCPVAEVKRTKKPVTLEHIHYNNNGNKRYVEVCGYPIFDDNGNVIQMIEYVLDITERKRIEKELLENEKKYHTIFNTSPDLLYRIGPNGKILECNDMVIKTIGYSKSELIGRMLFNIYADESKPYARKWFKEWLKTGKLRNKELKIETKHGRKIDVELNANAVYDSKGNIIYSISCQRDITYRKKMEQELRLKKEEIEKWNKELTERVEEGIKKIEETEKLALVGKLSAGIVHEINNPLYGISNYIELLLDEKNEEARNRYLKMISQGVDIIKSVTNNLLDLSQIGKLKLERANINELLENTLAFSMPDIEKSKVNVSLQIQKNIPDLLVDKNRIEEVFLNLITNALEAMPEGGNLEVSSKCIDNKMHISFVDTGTGISKENLGHIFEPFHSDKKKQGKRGVGLGLFMVSNILSLHNGEIKAESSEGKGSAFEVILPVNL